MARACAYAWMSAEPGGVTVKVPEGIRAAEAQHYVGAVVQADETTMSGS